MFPLEQLIKKLNNVLSHLSTHDRKSSFINLLYMTSQQLIGSIYLPFEEGNSHVMISWLLGPHCAIDLHVTLKFSYIMALKTIPASYNHDTMSSTHHKLSHFLLTRLIILSRFFFLNYIYIFQNYFARLWGVKNTSIGCMFKGVLSHS